MSDSELDSEKEKDAPLRHGKWSRKERRLIMTAAQHLMEECGIF